MKYKLKKIVVPIFTEEYKIIVAVGNVEQLADFVSKECEGWIYSAALEHCKSTRGSAFNRLEGTQKLHPIITLDADLPYVEILSTLPHEASHCADYITNFMGIDDRSGELRAHIISAVVRQTLRGLFGKKKLILSI